MKTRWYVPGLMLLATMATVRCGNTDHEQNHSELKREWDAVNAPERMGLVNDNYEVEFTSLPAQGRLSRLPWSGDYWATYKGGISYRWAHNSSRDQDRIFYNLLNYDNLSDVDLSELSPAEKYDIITGDRNWSMTQSERRRTNVMSRLDGADIPRWFGLCHAWAPATLLYKNPGPVDVSSPDGVSVPLGSSDIKALLTLYLDDVSSTTYFASRRCNIDDKELRKKLDRHEITRAEFDSIMNSADCRGINAGAYHIILTNMVGKRDKGFIADVTRGLEVWNQSVSGFRTRVLEERTQQISGQAAPGTVKEVFVETIMTYTAEIGHTWDRKQVPHSNKDVTYRYWLELDREGSIIGGNWISQDRPDFLWLRERPQPEFSGKWAALKDIVEHSTTDLIENGTGNDDGGAENGSINTGSNHLVSAPNWKIRKWLFNYIVDVTVKVSADVDEIRLESIGFDGSIRHVHLLDKEENGVFRLRNLPVAKWHAGGLNLVGYSKYQRKLFSSYKDY